jgi:hypothetical protein
MDRSTEEPQRVDSSRADAEWKADSGLGNLVHGNDTAVRPPDIIHHAFKTRIFETDSTGYRVQRSIARQKLRRSLKKRNFTTTFWEGKKLGEGLVMAKDL